MPIEELLEHVLSRHLDLLLRERGCKLRLRIRREGSSFWVEQFPVSFSSNSPTIVTHIPSPLRVQLNIDEDSAVDAIESGIQNAVKIIEATVRLQGLSEVEAAFDRYSRYIAEKVAIEALNPQRHWMIKGL